MAQMMIVLSLFNIALYYS